jgi:type IV pilus assembly protein PilX
MKTFNAFQWRHSHRKIGRQRGVALMIALIALVALTLAGIAIMRSIDTGNLISGNMSFQQAALQQTDVGVEAAFIALPNIVSSSKNTNIANQYFATWTRDDDNTMGVRSSINWASVPCRTRTNATVTCSDQDYQVRYIIERLCAEQTPGSTQVTNTQTYCYADIGSGKGGSKGAFSAAFTSVDAIYYRITVQVTGPRNTRAYSQAVIAKS